MTRSRLLARNVASVIVFPRGGKSRLLKGGEVVAVL